MTFAQSVYLSLVALGLLDMILILPAIFRATTKQTVVRLVASSLLIFGFVLSAAQRFAEHADLTVGLPLILFGLVLFVISLPIRPLGNR